MGGTEETLCVVCQKSESLKQMSQKMGGTEETLCVVCQKVRVHKANESENGGHIRNTVCCVPKK